MTRFCPKCQAETERNKKGDCKPCAKVRNAAWRKANLDKVRAADNAHYAANKEIHRIKAAVYYAKNLEKNKARSAAYYAANTNKATLSNAAWAKANIDKVKAYKKAWAKANPEVNRIKAQNRRARKRKNGGTLSKGLAQKLFKLQKGKCPCCKQPLGNEFNLDHIMPIALGGSNTDDNIQLLRSSCNNQKSAKHPIDFMQQRGFLI